MKLVPIRSPQRKRRTWTFGIIVGLAILGGAWAVAQISAPPQPLARWMPSGALFYLESSDFAAQLRDWNRSEVRTKWLASKNHEQFLTTRLVLKLKDAFEEFSAAAGFAPDLDALETFAGSDSAMAVYDIGRLDLLYISKLPSAQLAQNALTKVRSNYETRAAAGQSYFVRRSGSRTATFAIAGDFVIVGTREELIAEALTLIQGNGAPTPLSQSTWYDDAVRAMSDDARSPAALRLIMDLPAVIQTPYFRSYWIQANASDFRKYSAFLAQLRRGSDAWEESRVFVRAEETNVVPHDSAVSALQRFIPDDVGLFRLWDAPSVDSVMSLIRQKFFAADRGIPGERRSAPVFNADSVAGTESDLTTRIDEAPKAALGGALTLEPFKTLMDGAGIEAMLHLESSVPRSDATFVGTDVAIAIRASSSWNAAVVRNALTAAVASYQSVSSIGLQWRDVATGGRTLSVWDGLIPFAVFVDGQTLWIGRTPALLSTALNSSATTAPAAAYLARFNHRSERSSYLRVMRMLDLSEQQSYSSFFSENIGSLASSLDVIDSVSIRTNETAQAQRQVIHYSLAR